MFVMRILIPFLLILLAISAHAQKPEFSTLSNWRNHNDRWVERQGGGYMLYRRLNERAFALLDERDREVGGIRTAAGWEQRRAYVRETLEELLGPWPEKTPLKARVVGTIEREGYRIEKVVYESIPGFHVTAALYIPKGSAEKRPGILYIPGHANNGFRASHYVNACLNLVHKGFVVLAYDPIGQGERHQELDANTGERIVDPEQAPHYKMHSYTGNQCFLAGVSLSRYFVWDAIRGIDYLVSRPEVDAERIGLTGNSGGGNLTVYTGAVDDRVKVAVPSCFVTSYRRMLQLNGVQDAEQNVYHALLRGIEHADWLLARAPKPTLMLTTTHDFFPIQGARETEAAVKEIYGAMGAPDDFGRVEDDHGHGYTRKTSEASYAFFMKHFGVSGSPAEEMYPAPSEEELQVTGSGQVATQFKAENVFSLNLQESAGLLANLVESRQRDGHRSRVLSRARELSGYRPPAGGDDAVYRGGFQRDGYRIEKYTLDGGPNSVVPMLLALPEGDGPHPAVVYLHPDGKEAVAADGGVFEQLTAAGYAVLAPDVIGTGETAPAIGRQNDHNSAYYEAALIGSSVVGLQAEDLVRAVAWLQSEERIQADRIGLVATESMGPSAIHATAFHPEISWLILDRTFSTYASVAMNRVYTVPTSSLVPGALTAYDLPDLLASIAPRRVAILGPRDQQMNPLTEVEAASAYAATMGASLRILVGGEQELTELVQWSGQ
jgi:cephalosporin-C deacetylase-like acetyl esterase